MPKIYTKEQKDFIIDMIVNYKLSYRQLIPIFNKKFNANKTYDQLRSSGRYWGLKSDKNVFKTGQYTEEQKNFIVEMIIDNDITWAQLTPLFNKRFNTNKSLDALRNYGNRTLGLTVTHRVKTKLKVDYFDYYENQQPVGTIISVRENKQYSLRIKVKLIPKEKIFSSDKTFPYIYDDEYWCSYPRYVYEQHYKVKLKPNEKIIHLDGNQCNNNIENLICVNFGAIGFAASKGFLDSELEIRSIGLKLGKLNTIIKNEV